MPRPNGTTVLTRCVSRLMAVALTKRHYRRVRALSFGLKLVTGVEIQPGARIGERIFVEHGASVVVGHAAVVGSDCLIHHEVTIGHSHGRAPTVGDRVCIYPGAKLFGPIQVGDDAVIGANAVVFFDVPAGATVLAPAGQLTADS